MEIMMENIPAVYVEKIIVMTVYIPEAGYAIPVSIKESLLSWLLW